MLRFTGIAACSLDSSSGLRQLMFVFLERARRLTEHAPISDVGIDRPLLLAGSAAQAKTFDENSINYEVEQGEFEVKGSGANSATLPLSVSATFGPVRLAHTAFTSCSGLTSFTARAGMNTWTPNKANVTKRHYFFTTHSNSKQRETIETLIDKQIMKPPERPPNGYMAALADLVKPRLKSEQGVENEGVEN